MIDAWGRDRQVSPAASRIILTHTNDEVQALNQAARERLPASGDLGDDVTVRVERGARQFAPGDRVMFLRNERSLGVKNGSLGRIEGVSSARMAVQLDDGRSVALDVKDYNRIDHGYAATIHKAQGVTVDRAHVLATPGLDRHAAYVALSRHRDSVKLHYGRDDFADESKLVRTLSRDRPKDMASDHIRDPAASLRRVFAERRGIVVSSPAIELPQKAITVQPVPRAASSTVSNCAPRRCRRSRLKWDNRSPARSSALPVRPRTSLRSASWTSRNFRTSGSRSMPRSGSWTRSAPTPRATCGARLPETVV